MNFSVRFEQYNPINRVLAGNLRRRSNVFAVAMLTTLVQFSVTATHAQVIKIANYDVPNNVNINENNYAARNVASGFVVSPMQLNNVGGGGFTGHYQTGGWESSLNPDKYIYFTVTPTQNAVEFDRIALSQFNFSGNDTPSYVAVRTSADNFSTTLDTASIPFSYQSWTNTLDLSAVPYTSEPIEFRVYFYGHNTGGWQGSGVFSGHVGFAIYGERVCSENGLGFAGSDCDANGLDDSCDLAGPGRFENAAGAGDYQLNGSAALDGGSIRLTSATQGQRGSVVFDPVSMHPVGGFTASFDFKVGGGNGADGLNFALMDASLHGPSSNFGETGPGNGSLSVSLDTYAGNPASGNHARLIWNGTILRSEWVDFILNDNEWHHAEIEFDGTNLTLTLTPAAGPEEVFFGDVTIPGFVPIVSRYGLGARTGAAYDEHRVDNIRFRDTSSPNDCQGNSVPDTCEPDDDVDGVPNACDVCPGQNDLVDADGDAVPDGCDACNGDDAFGDTDSDGVCDDIDPCPVDNPDDTDGDGVCNSVDMCEGDDATLDFDGDGVCSDLDPCPSSNPDDIDGDGVCGRFDQCDGDDATGDPDNDDICSDLDPCPFDNPDDTDGDGVCETDDVCLGNDALGDTDGDGLCDDTDPCPLDDPNDTDLDGVCDSDDLCDGDNATGDVDGDGVCGNLDPCPLDAADDSDFDGVCDSDDVCPGFTDHADLDNDGIPDGCDPCAGGPGSGDTNGDTARALDDYADMYECMTGPQGSLTEKCECFDYDDSGSVTLYDFAEFQNHFTGAPE